MECSHISKVLEWGFNEDHDFIASKWGCVLCDIVTDRPFLWEDDIEIDHTNCDYDCFGCKARGLQMNTGDAGRDIPDKAWKARLKGYSDARAQGIQPGGTTPQHVQAAYNASETLNKAYDGNTMVPAHKVTKGVAEVMKEIGA